MTQPPTTVYLLDDQAMIRAAFRGWIDRTGVLKVVGEKGDPRQALDEIARLRPQILLLDIAMPGLSGFDVIPKVRAAHPDCRILMLTNHEGDSFVQQAIELGADGYLSKDSDPAELTIAIAAVLAGKPYISPKVAGGLVARARGGDRTEDGRGSVLTLTPREREVFVLLAMGKTNKEVARDCKISIGTVKKHRENVQRKLDCRSPAELARLAIREGLLGS